MVARVVGFRFRPGSFRARQRELGLDEAGVDELVEDFWRWYVGTLDRELFDWFAGLRERGFVVGILSNSAPGARERERCWGFEAITDDIVYSHEVGLVKPDPAIFRLLIDRHRLDPASTVFIDDSIPNVEAAARLGFRSVAFTGAPELRRALAALGVLPS